MQRIEINLISKNNGQIEGVPKNPRQWKKGEVEKLARSIEQTPELFDLRPIIVYDNVDGYVAIGGNMRLEAAKLLKWRDVPCEIVSRETPTAKLKEIVIKDNGAFGEWDMDMLANEWDDLPLSEWGLPLGDWNSEVEVSPDEFGDNFTLPSGEKSNIETVSLLMSKEQADAVKNALKEAQGLEEYKYLETFGNENKNGNAAYLIIMQWANARK